MSSSKPTYLNDLHRGLQYRRLHEDEGVDRNPLGE
jgi:hypothetical protein